MAVINIRMLNYNLKEQIEMGRLSEENVAMVREKVKAGNKTALIGYIVASCIIVAMLGFCGYQILAHTPNLQEELPKYLIGGGILLAVILGTGYLITVGLMKIQFNKALKEGYPHLYKQLKV